MTTRPVYLTDEMIASRHHLDTTELYNASLWEVKTWAERHGKNQAEIDAHKELLKSLKPMFKIAEKIKLEKELSQALNRVDELEKALNGYL